MMMATKITFLSERTTSDAKQYSSLKGEKFESLDLMSQGGGDFRMVTYESWYITSSRPFSFVHSVLVKLERLPSNPSYAKKKSCALHEYYVGRSKTKKMLINSWLICYPPSNCRLLTVSTASSHAF